jgi:predicted aldo/keto reductase-like oxidoreductase
MRNSQLNRRNFLRLSAAGAAGGMLLSNAKASEPNCQAISGAVEAGDGIITRTLGRTGLVMPVISLGVMRVDNPKLVTGALDGGMKFLDTANGYQGGRNEEMLGVLLKDRPRDSYMIATKVSARGDEMSTQAFLDKLDTSLKRLNLDHVDILYLHGASNKPYMLNENHLAALRKAKESGKTRFVGVSTHENMTEIINTARESGFYDVVLTSYNFRMASDTAINKAIEDAAKAGVGIIAMKTMAGGFWDKARTQKINTTAALKWALQNPHITTSIPGCTAFEHLEENLKTIKNITLTALELEDLKEKPATTGLFCTGCQQCISDCPKGLKIPDMMRAYMYAYGYKDLALARKTMDGTSYGNNPCQGCSSCKVNCKMGFDVAEKIADISRISNIPMDLIA